MVLQLQIIMSPALVMLSLICITLIHECSSTKLPENFTAILVFGDSTVDCGNNNHIGTLFKGNHPPYGQDFSGGVPTGRFSNGKLVPDMLASITGLKETVPPYLDPNLSDENILTGVSFASAGSGFDDFTTSLSRVIPMSEQLGYFKKYIQRLEGVAGIKRAQRILNRALVVFSAGTNDFIFNFYDVPTRRLEFTIDEYQNFLLTKLKDMLKELYHLGCRRFLISGLPTIGCLPIQVTVKSPILRTCDDSENEETESYNEKLQKLLPRIETELPGSRILYVDIYNPMMGMINNPQKYGFVETLKGCCGSGILEVGPFCNELSTVCENPSQYIFYDSIHPTESTYRIISNQIAELLFPNL